MGNKKFCVHVSLRNAGLTSAELLRVIDMLIYMSIQDIVTKNFPYFLTVEPFFQQVILKSQCST